LEGLASEVLVGADVPMKEQGSEFSLSVLDLCPVLAGGSAADALRRSLDLARHTEKLGYHRYWVAEHHNMPGIASAATSVVIGHVAEGTSTIRVGSGGIMLLNHAPLVIAEQFGTLENVFAAETDKEAERLATSHFQAHLQIARGIPVELPPPANSFEEVWKGQPAELPFLRSSIIGSPFTVQARLRSLVQVTQADELIIHSMIFDHEARRRSYEIVWEVAGSSAIFIPGRA